MYNVLPGTVVLVYGIIHIFCVHSTSTFVYRYTEAVYRNPEYTEYGTVHKLVYGSARLV